MGRVLRFLLVGLALPATLARAQRIELIDCGETWKYFKGTVDPSVPVTAWTAGGFDDSAWLDGATGIGYGGGDDLTVLADMQNGYITLYARRTFDVANPATFAGLFLDLSYDDGFAAYLNGSEILRANLPAGPLGFATPALAAVNPQAPPARFDLTSALPLLRAGSNILAVEVHNGTLASTDLSFYPRLFATGANPVIRGPFLQMVGETSALIAWQTVLASQGTVEYGTQGVLTLQATEAAPVTDHAVTLTGLAADRLYDYRVAEGGLAMTLPFTFRTAKQRANTRFRVVALGDSGGGTLDQWNVARLLQALEPDLVLHTGDVIYDAGEAANYDPRFFEPYRQSIDRVSLWPVLGNHDVLTGGGQPFLDAFHLPANNPAGSEAYYSFRWADTLFVALDTNGGVPAPGDAQYLWLEDALRSSGECFKVLLFHHPPYDSGTGHGTGSGGGLDADCLAVRASLIPLIDQYGVDLVINGHEHNYERTFPMYNNVPVDTAMEPSYVDPAGTVYAITGGGGQALYATGREQNWTARSLAAFHVLVLDRDNDTWTLSAREADGTLGGREFDRATLRKTACALPVTSVYRSVNRFDVPANLLLTTTLRTYDDPAPAASIFYYQVEPATLLKLTRLVGTARLGW